jgi:hypothetical protein
MGLIGMLMIACVALAGLAMMMPTAPATVSDEDRLADVVQPFLPVIGYILISLFVLWIIKKIVDAGLLIPIFVIICGLVLVISISWIFTYGDKNNDGMGDPQIVRMIQPSGQDADTDSKYSDVNLTNAKANGLSVLEIMGYTTLIYLGVILFAVVGAYLHFMKK